MSEAVRAHLHVFVDCAGCLCSSEHIPRPLVVEAGAGAHRERKRCAAIRRWWVFCNRVPARHPILQAPVAVRGNHQAACLQGAYLA